MIWNILHWYPDRSLYIGITLAVAIVVIIIIHALPETDRRMSRGNHVAVCVLAVFIASVWPFMILILPLIAIGFVAYLVSRLCQLIVRNLVDD